MGTEAESADLAAGEQEAAQGPSLSARLAQRAQSLESEFERLRVLEPALREQQLSQLARSDAALAQELRSLLEHFDRIDGFLSQPVSATQVPGFGSRGSFIHPQEVGGFRLVEELGRGASGVVWLAEQARPRRPVALKLLRWDHPGSEAIRRFQLEGELLARLDHPACARVIETGLLERGGAPPVPWIAMSYVDGQPLGKALAGRSWVQVLETFEALAAGVHAAHLAGIVHRDLKPENVLVEANGQPVVLDFGVARLLDDGASSGLQGADSPRTLSGWLLGTPAYMAPEQARGERARIDARTDIFALGVMLYEALTGELPIDTRGATLSEALRRIGEHHPAPLRKHRVRLATQLPSAPPHSVQRDLESVLAQALHREPERRYPSAHAFAADLASVRQGRPVAARPPSSVYRSLRFVQRNRALSLAVGAALLSLSLGLAASLRALDRTRAAERATRLEQVATHRLADLNVIAELERLDEELWPATPANEPALARWVGIGHGLRERLAPDLIGLAEHPETVAEEEREPLARAAAFLSGSRPLHGLSGLETRLDRARRVEQETIRDHAADWDLAAQRVAQDPRFLAASGANEPVGERFSLEPIVGLIPLGPDPDSGLEEFAEWPWTGTLPSRDPSTGRLHLTESTALVLVLIPGGRQRISRLEGADDAPFSYAPAEDLGDVHELTLDPFLIGKYEFTQGQWNALGFENPSYWAKGDHAFGIDVDDGFPVETVTWTGAITAASRLGFSLPTEVQFDVAFLAGQGTDWWQPPSRASLIRWSRIPLFHDSSAGDTDPESGFPLPAYVPLPVGCLAPNPYGLHEIYGNLNEWCLDTFWVRAGRSILQRSGDGRAVHPDPFEEANNPHRAIRCCSGWTKAPPIRPGPRVDRTLAGADPCQGFRLARTLSAGARPR